MAATWSRAARPVDRPCDICFEPVSSVAASVAFATSVTPHSTVYRSRPPAADIPRRARDLTPASTQARRSLSRAAAALSAAYGQRKAQQRFVKFVTAKKAASEADQKAAAVAARA